MDDCVELPVSVPGLRALRCTMTTLLTGMKEYYCVARIESGHAEWWGNGKVWRSRPGCIQVKQPGDVHRDLSRDGPMTFTVVKLPADDIANVREEGRGVAFPQLDASDARAIPFHRLHDVICAGIEGLSLEVAVAEAVSAFATISDARSHHTRPVRRAMEYLRGQLHETIHLDDLAVHAGIDKFHLCRAFRAQVGMPPHAYLTRLRIARAKDLLASGVRAAEVASRVGLYDQAQLTRHFRRIVGTTPGRYRNEWGSLSALPAEA